MPNLVRWVVVGIVGVVAVVAVVLLHPSSGPSLVSPAAVRSASPMQELNPERLVGRWLRSDGGYVLEIRRTEPDGRLDAAYLNPRSIHVSRAEWRREETKHCVHRAADVNYQLDIQTGILS
jgi:hypothetical protein